MVLELNLLISALFVILNVKLLFIFSVFTKKLSMFWENVSSWIVSKLKFRIILQPFNMLFGVKQVHKFSLIINCPLLQARFLIFRCKIKNETPHIQK